MYGVAALTFPDETFIYLNPKSKLLERYRVWQARIILQANNPVHEDQCRKEIFSSNRVPESIKEKGVLTFIERKYIGRKGVKKDG